MGLRAQKKDRTRQLLIETAYRLFSDDGYDRTSVTRIAEEAGVSPATFFNYFPTKDDLVFPDAERVITAGLAEIEAAASVENPADVLGRAISVMISTTRGTSRDPGSQLETTRLRLVGAEPKLRARFVERAAGSLDRFSAALLAGYPHALDEDRASALVGAVFGAALASATIAVRRGRAGDYAMIDSVDLVVRSMRTNYAGADHAQVTDVAAQGFEPAPYVETADLARDGLAILGDSSPDRSAYLEEMASLNDFLTDRLPDLLAEWRRTRLESGR